MHGGNDDWAGASSLPEPIGRDQILRTITDVVKDPSEKPQLIVLRGQGGYGKTRVLQRILKMFSDDDRVFTAKQLIDLYHIRFHTSFGLADGFVSVLEPGYFGEYFDDRDAIEGRIATGQGMHGDDLSHLLETFGTSLSNMAQSNRLVLLLDTVERIIYSPVTSVPQKDDVAEAWSWLTDVLPTWKNVVLIVAGRPAISPLVEQLANRISSRVLDVGPFSLEESLEYFDAISRHLQESGRFRAAGIIEHLPHAFRVDTHDQSGGSPILLSLAIDLLTVEGHMPSAEPEDIVRRIMLSPEIGETIRAVARAPKGVTPKLFAKLRACGQAEAQERMKRVSELSFVKVRPDDNRLFLHDEMYHLVNTYIFDETDAPAAEAARRQIDDHYREELNGITSAQNELFAPIENGQPGYFNYGRLTELVQVRRRLLVEHLYYLLHRSAVRGFQYYYRYMREAIHAGDTLLDRELHLTLLEFWHERDPEGKLEQIDGLERSQIVGVSRLRPVTQAWAERRYDDAIYNASEIRSSFGSENTRHGVVTSAVLNAWEAYARAYRSESDDLDIAYSLTTEALDNLFDYTEYHANLFLEDDMLVPENLGEELIPSHPLVWRARAATALNHRVRGYVRFLRQDLDGAVIDYQAAARLWTSVRIFVEEAITRNDLGRVLGDLDRWDDARDLVEHALFIRRELGSRLDVGLSLNTLAILDIAEERYWDAGQRSERTRALFSALNDPRGRGLALTILSEARRKFAVSDMGPADMIQKANMLREAHDLAEEAAEIFEEIDEGVRWVRAKLESGRAYRDLIGLIGGESYRYSDIERLKARAEADFTAAIDKANAIGNRYYALDGLIDVMSMADTLQDDVLFERILQSALAFVPGKDLSSWELDIGVASDKAMQTLLGKLFAMLGHRTMDQHLRTNLLQPWRRSLTPDLDQAVEWYILGLEHYRRFDSDRDFADIRKTTTEVHRRVRELRAHEIRHVQHCIQRIETEQGIDSSKLREILERRALQ